MRSGLLQQVASPQELYERPANLFVAGFIGSPAMNFLGGTLEEGSLRTGLGDLPLSGQLLQELSSSARGRQMIVGIRPEDFEDASLVPSENRHNGITFRSNIDLVESLGSEKYVYFTQELGTVDAAELTELARDSGRAEIGGAGETVVARFDPATRLTEGDHADIWVDVRRMHVFDPDTGRNLSLGDSGSPASPAGPRGGGAPAQAEAAAGQDTGSTAAPPR
jgi:multiple sugar transport system ATP-binding protein